MMRFGILFVLFAVFVSAVSALESGIEISGELDGSSALHPFEVVEGRDYELFVSSDSVDVELSVLRGSNVFIRSDRDRRSFTTDAYARWSAGRSETLTARVEGDTSGPYTIKLVERGVLSSNFSLNRSEGPLGSTFEAYVNVSCDGGPCGEVIVTLDPYIDPQVRSLDDDDMVIVVSDEGREVTRVREALDRVSSLRSVPEQVRDRIGRSAPREPSVAVFANLEVFAMLDESVASIGTSAYWSESFGSGSVCVIDSGVDYTHPALGGCARTSDINDASCDVVIGGYDFVDDDADPFDGYGHGTHVAGIVASRDAQYRGVAPSVSIVAVRVLDNRGRGSIDQVIEGIEYCTQMRDVYDIRAIVMSLGTNRVYHGSCDILPEAQAVANAHEAGIAVFAAAGNYYNQHQPYLGVSSPACAPHAVAVGALDGANIASLSARDTGVLFAPGIFITSSDKDGAFLARSGTSMAAPHGAGSALLLSGFWEERYARTLAPEALRLMLSASGSVSDSSLRSYPSLHLDDPASRKGVVPTTPGARPFWTSSDNPQSCALDDGDSCSLNWTVIGEGPSGAYVFFAYLDTDFGVSKTEEQLFKLADARITYDTDRTLLPAGEYEARIEIFSYAPELITVSIEAQAESDSLVIEVPRSDGYYVFNRTVNGPSDGGSIETVSASFGDRTIEVWNEYSFDTIPPQGTLADVIPAAGSFEIVFDEPMDTALATVSFPDAALVDATTSWLDDRTLMVMYSAANASFDDVVLLDHDAADRAGNPALIPSVRLDAVVPTIVSFDSNASVLGVNGSVGFVFEASEELASVNVFSDALDCTISLSGLAGEVVCVALQDAVSENAVLSLVLEDVAGNTNQEDIGTGVSVDASVPVGSLPSLLSAFGSFAIVFDKDMDTALSSVVFPDAALVSSNVSWLDDRTLFVEYASSNASFDESLVLLHDLSDRVGNRAVLPSVRLDAVVPWIVSFDSNASVLGVNGSVAFSFVSSEELASVDASSDELICDSSVEGLDGEIMCSAVSGADTQDALLTIVLEDIAGNSATVAIDTGVSVDTTPPVGSLPSLLSAFGSFDIVFDKDMDTHRNFLVFPDEALVVATSSWLDDRTLFVEYASSNASFDESLVLLHDLSDRAGNRAVLPSVRLDAVVPWIVSFDSNASVLGVNGSVTFVFEASEELASANVSSEALDCEVSGTGSVWEVLCTAVSGFESEDVLLVFELEDHAGNRVGIDQPTGVLVDTKPPRMVPITLGSDDPSQVTILFEDLTPITIPGLGFNSSLNTSVILAHADEGSYAVFDLLGNEVVLTVSVEVVEAASEPDSPARSRGGSGRSGGSFRPVPAEVEEPEALPEEEVRSQLESGRDDPVESAPEEVLVGDRSIYIEPTDPVPVDDSLEEVSMSPRMELPVMLALFVGAMLAVAMVFRSRS